MNVLFLLNRLIFPPTDLNSYLKLRVNVSKILEILWEVTSYSIGDREMSYEIIKNIF